MTTTPDWLPIHTAPKDQRIDVHNGSKRFTDVRWSNTHQDFVYPHCGGELSAKTPILRHDEPTMTAAADFSQFPHFSQFPQFPFPVLDPRPKCPHCLGKFDLIVELPADVCVGSNIQPLRPTENVIPTRSYWRMGRHTTLTL